MEEARLGLLVEDTRQQRSSTILQDVDYLIEAHFPSSRHRETSMIMQSIMKCSNAGP